jgi:integral membrane sensor domain MASE1
MTGIIKFTASIAVLLVAGLATLLVFDIIPPDVFSNAFKKVVLTGAITVLTAVALALIMRLGK